MFYTQKLISFFAVLWKLSTQKLLEIGAFLSVVSYSTAMERFLLRYFITALPSKNNLQSRLEPYIEDKLRERIYHRREISFG